MLGLLWGCQPDDGIRQYQVENIPTTAKPDLSQATEQSAWFFKLTGPADEVLEQIVPFSQLVKSLQFDADGMPQYELPQGWTATNGPPPRYQTLKIAPAESPLEVTLSSLPGPRRDFGGYLLSNFNRWREQLGLEPYRNDDWLEKSRSSGELMVVPLERHLMAMINLVGEMPEKGRSRILGAVILFPPMDAENATSATPRERVEPKADAASEKSPTAPVMAAAKPALDYQTPEGWSPSAGNAMRLASFEVKHESGTVDVSVTRFPGGGDTLANVNRWRGQVKLDPLSEADLEKNSRKMTIGGRDAIYAKAIGKEESILAAIVPEGESKWFFKMQGPEAAVAAETGRFEEFLQSVKFEKSK